MATGDITIEDFRLLDTSPLIPILIKAIKELKVELDDLENSVRR
jgi:hypothetical protein